MPPMGMFPGPMGIPGPGMGPFMPGLRPGLGGFGGPIGPVSTLHLEHINELTFQNVAPTLRRPGFFPPGVPATSGDYGLPAAARYGNNFGPSRPGMAPTTTTPDTGLGNTTSESTTPSATTEELVTPTTGHTPIAPPRIASTETQVHDSPHVTHEETHTHEETPAHEEIPTGPPMETVSCAPKTVDYVDAYRTSLSAAPWATLRLSLRRMASTPTRCHATFTA
jgi:hypothetical protein